MTCNFYRSGKSLQSTPPYQHIAISELCQTHTGENLRRICWLFGIFLKHHGSDMAVVVDLNLGSRPLYWPLTFCFSKIDYEDLSKYFHICALEGKLYVWRYVISELWAGELSRTRLYVQDTRRPTYWYHFAPNHHRHLRGLNNISCIQQPWPSVNLLVISVTLHTGLRIIAMEFCWEIGRLQITVTLHVLTVLLYIW